MKYLNHILSMDKIAVLKISALSFQIQQYIQAVKRIPKEIQNILTESNLHYGLDPSYSLQQYYKIFIC